MEHSRPATGAPLSKCGAGFGRRNRDGL
jgi:hypothetical protein